MTDITHPAEQALLPLPLAEEIDPQVFIDYEAFLLSRKTRTTPNVQYSLYCNTLDLAIATRSTGWADEAYAGFDSLLIHPDFDLTKKPFTYVRTVLAYEEAMRCRVARRMVSSEVKATTYCNFTAVMRDVLATDVPAKGRAHRMRSGYISEALALSGLLRKKPGVFPYFSLSREESNLCHSSGNHDFSTFQEQSYKSGKQAWQVKTIMGAASLPPVKTIYVRALVDEAFTSCNRMLKRRDEPIIFRKFKERPRYLADLMIRENWGELSPQEAILLGRFSSLITSFVRGTKEDIQNSSQGR